MSQKLYKRTLMVLVVFLGFSGGWLIGRIASAYDVSFIGLALTILFYSTLAFVFHIIVHELGHLFAGFASGYKFSMIRFFEFSFIKKEKGFTFKKVRLPGSMGQCLMVPSSKQGDPFKTQLYNYGGVIANGVLTLLFIVMVALSKDSIYMVMFSTMMVIIGLLLIYSNAISIEGSFTDGTNASFLRENPQYKDYFWNVMHISDALFKGKSIKEIDKRWMKRVPDETLIVPFMFNCDFYYFEACGSAVERAERYHFYKTQEIIPMFKTYTDISIACFDLENEQTIEVTPQMAQLMKLMKGDPLLEHFRMLDALYYEKNVDKAEGILLRYDKITRYYPYEGERQRYRQKLQVSMNEYKRKQNVVDNGKDITKL